MTVWARASASSGPPPLMRMPRRAACATPAMKATGAARISGQGVAATSTARPRSGSPEISQATSGEREGDGQEDQRIAVGQPDERRLGGLRRGHQPHDAGIGALAGESRTPHLKGLAGIERAGQDARRRAPCATGIGSPVSADSSMRRSGRVTTPSTGTISPARTSSRSPTATARYRHLLDAALGAAMRVARRAIDQRVQITLGAGDREILEHIAAGIHERDDDAGQRLAERERRTHRHERDRIDAEPPGEQIAHNRNRQSRDHG